MLHLLSVLLLLPTIWQSFQNLEGKFVILVPGEMQQKTNIMETGVGSIDYHTFYYQDTTTKAVNYLYMVSYCDYPEGTMHEDSIEIMDAFWAATVESSVASVKGELKYNTDAEFQGHKGRFWRVDYDQNTTSIKSRCFMVERRFYMVQVLSRQSRNINKDADKFLDSMRLL